MEKFKVSFEANNQQLKSHGTKHASDTYADIEATFVLGEKWTDMDSVSAVWWNDFTRIATVLDSDGKCIVPHEVLTRKGYVRVNLVGSVVENGELVTRLTSYSAEAVKVNEKIKLTGSETSEITPSQYEQFVANVKADADRAEAGATASANSADEAEASAQNASESASASAVSASDSARSATASAGYAQNASESAQSAENAKDDAEDARDKILSMRATASTLPAGSDATASYSDGMLSLGIPKGDKGDTGAKGDKGDTGAKGDKGDTGDTGNGIASITHTGTSGAVKTYTITFTDGTSQTYDVTDGQVTTEQMDTAIDNAVTDVKSEINDLPFEIYNVNEVKDDYYLNSSGNEISQVGWSVSDYLKIGYNTTYYVPVATTSSAVFCWFYDENKLKIESFQTTVRGWNDLVAPPNAVFARFSIETNYKSGFKYNSLILIPYSDGAIIPNLIEKNRMVSSFEDDVYVGFNYSATGIVNYSANWALLPLYRVEKGDVFYMDYPFSQYLTCFDENKQFVSAQIAPTNGVPITYTIPSGVAFIGVSLLKARLGTYDLKLNGQPLGAQYKIAWLRSGIWENKSYISHGDSITWQDGEEYIQGEHIGEIAKGYQTVFAENVNLGRKSNYGKSGWSMAVVNGNGVVNAVLQITRYTQFDLCTIACGTNDFKLNVPLGTLGQIGDTTFDDSTFYGAYRKAVEYILTQSPTIRLVLMTPLQRDNSGYDVNYTNSAGHKLIDYVNAVKAVGQMYGLPVCDMYSNSGFTKKTLATYTMDGLHPNDAGYKRMGDYLTGFLNVVGN